ncbi:MAG: HD domain-containing protein [Solirubrobacterales bacterium]|nr:HD domain-containing protein [Solirubrobacterales bacterium]
MTDPLQALARLGIDGWLVGGAVRDRLLGRPTSDFDVAVIADAAQAAAALARASGGYHFKLSEGFGAWRVGARDRSWQLDVLPLSGESIEADLARRDFTINAMAQVLGSDELVDPFGGVNDLSARSLRAVSPAAFTSDPLRVVRLARLACELSFEAEPATIAAARASVAGLHEVAGERVFGELKRIVVSERAVVGLELLESAAATDVVLPELAALRGVQQSRYHHLDVLGHTLAVLEETMALEHEPERWLGERAQEIVLLLSEPLADGLSRGQALRFGALFHDVAKPVTRAVTSEGRVTFIGHDSTGAQMTRAALSRLRASERLADYVAGLTRHHLRLGFLVHETPLGRRAIYRYLRSCEPVEVDVTLLSVADRLATRGRGSDRAIARHLELAKELLDEALSWRAHRPRPPVRGDELGRELGLPPGPELGRLLAELEEASFAREIESPEQAIERARELLGGGRVPDR